MHAVSQYYSQTQMSQTAAQVYQHRDVSKVLYTTQTHWNTSCLIMLTLQCRLTISVHLKNSTDWKGIILCRNTHIHCSRNAKQLTCCPNITQSLEVEILQPSFFWQMSGKSKAWTSTVSKCLLADTASFYDGLLFDLLQIVHTVIDQNRSEIRLSFLCRHIQYVNCMHSAMQKVCTDCVSYHITSSSYF